MQLVAVELEVEFYYFDLLPKSLKEILDQANIKWSAKDAYILYKNFGEAFAINIIRQEEETQYRIYMRAMERGFREEENPWEVCNNNKNKGL